MITATIVNAGNDMKGAILMVNGRRFAAKGITGAHALDAAMLKAGLVSHLSLNPHISKADWRKALSRSENYPTFEIEVSTVHPGYYLAHGVA